jgi:hypothetical protein
MFFLFFASLSLEETIITLHFIQNKACALDSMNAWCAWFSLFSKHDVRDFLYECTQDISFCACPRSVHYIFCCLYPFGFWIHM